MSSDDKPISTIVRIRVRTRIRLRRARDAWYDRLARRAGYCNDASGPYTHWRCALDATHDGMHRYRNYVWDRNGTTYLPVPISRERPLPDQPWQRSTYPARHRRADAVQE
jgi:hypothetical protein